MIRWRCGCCHHSDVPHRRRTICDDCDAYNTARALAWCSGRGGRPHRVAASAMATGRSWCRACDRRYWSQAPHRDRARQRAAQWRARNPERVQAYATRPDVIARERARKRAWWLANRPRVRALRRARYLANRAHEIQAAQQWRARNPARAAQLWRQSRARARLRILRGGGG